MTEESGQKESTGIAGVGFRELKIAAVIIAVTAALTYFLLPYAVFYTAPENANPADLYEAANFISYAYIITGAVVGIVFLAIGAIPVAGLVKGQPRRKKICTFVALVPGFFVAGYAVCGIVTAFSVLLSGILHFLGIALQAMANDIAFAFEHTQVIWTPVLWVISSTDRIMATTAIICIAAAIFGYRCVEASFKHNEERVQASTRKKST